MANELGGRTEELFEALARLSDSDPRCEEIRTELVELHTRLARHIARRYANRGEPLEDLEQAAMLGLVKAINRFDPKFGRGFLAYAVPTMTGEVKRHFRDTTWGVRMPRRIQELRLALQTALRDFTQEHGRAPTVSQIAAMLEISEEETVEVLGAFDAYRPVSLDVQFADDDGAETLGELIGEEDPALDYAVDRVALRPLLDKLPSRERMIILYRFFGNKTQTEIAELMHISQMHVSRLISRSLSSLKFALLQET